MNHKIVCWGDYAIPVPKKAKWIAMDEDGTWYWYTHEPVAEEHRTVWGDAVPACSLAIMANNDVCLEPPEPGPWTEQLYWIGD